MGDPIRYTWHHTWCWYATDSHWLYVARQWVPIRPGPTAPNKYSNQQPNILFMSWNDITGRSIGTISFLISQRKSTYLWNVIYVNMWNVTLLWLIISLLWPTIFLIKRRIFLDDIMHIFYDWLPWFYDRTSMKKGDT